MKHRHHAGAVAVGPAALGSDPKERLSDEKAEGSFTREATKQVTEPFRT